MKVALIQMEIALGQPALNRARAAEWIAEAAAGADLVMLPEMWTTGYALADLAENLADRDGEPTGTLLAEQARQHGIYLAGSVAEERQGKVYNLATLHGPDGRKVAEYAKIHLVPMMDEPHYLTSGDRVVVGEMLAPAPALAPEVGAGSDPIGADAARPVPVGLAICYDLRFPELFRMMALGGAELVLLPAEWPVQRLAHWRTLLMARAIENQCFVLGCNRVGSDGQNSFPGHSLVVDPWGNILAEGGEGEEIVRAEIDLDRVAEIRRQVPVFRDRRPDAYRL